VRLPLPVPAPGLACLLRLYLSPCSHRVLYWMPSALKYSGYSAPTQFTTWLMLCCARILLSRATASPETYSPSATCVLQDTENTHTQRQNESSASAGSLCAGTKPAG
jgi:hypothetical protein